MNRVEMISKVTEVLAENGVKVTKKDMGTYVDTMIDVIKTALVDGEDVKIAGLGTFSVVERPERVCRNPQDGSEVIVPEHKAPKFKYASSVKELVR